MSTSYFENVIFIARKEILQQYHIWTFIIFFSWPCSSCEYSLLVVKHQLIYLIDSDRRPVSNRRPLLKSASTDVIISNHGPILGYSQIDILSKLSYL